MRGRRTARQFFLAMILLALLVCAANPLAAGAQGAQQGIVVAHGSVNVRMGPGTTQERIGLLAPGDAVPILGKSGEWYQIEYADGIGYVISDHLVVVSSDQMQALRATGGKVAGARAVNIRERPDVDSDKVGQLEPGASCEVYGIRDGWYLVRFEAVSGYIREDLLSVDGPIATLADQGALSDVRERAVTPDAEQQADEQAGDDDGADYVLVTREEGSINIDQRLNVRGGPGTEYEVVGKLSPGDLFEVLEAANAWSRIQAGDIVGYVLSEYITVKTVSVRQPRIEEAALEASLTGFSSPTVLKGGQAFALTGSVRANVPIVRVSVAVYNLDTLSDELVAGSSFSHAQNMLSFDLSALDDQLPMGKLKGGEKQFRITVHSANELATFEGTVFSVLGEARSPASATEACEITATNSGVAKATDGDLSSAWSMSRASDVLTIAIPPALDAQLLTLSWAAPEAGYTLTYLDANGQTLATARQDERSPLVCAAHELPVGTRKVELRCGGKEARLCELRVYERGRVPASARQWRAQADKVDILFVSTHQDDELLFFGGAIPDSVARGKEAAVLYMANCSRARYEEAMEGLWAVGLRAHPVFLGLKDKFCETLKEAKQIWDSEAALRALVAQIRRLKPDVVVTHDVEGEYGHGQHRLTCALTREAMDKAADAAFDPDSAALYGVWTVKKLYLHLYPENARQMDWSVPLAAFDGRTALEMATVAYDKHRSQHGAFSMEKTGVKYDNTAFGLAHTTVGIDVKKDSFFENIES